MTDQTPAGADTRHQPPMGQVVCASPLPRAPLSMHVQVTAETAHVPEMFSARPSSTEMGPEHAQSTCSLSGLNDHHPPETDTDQVQSYGQIIRGKFLPPGYNRGGAAIPGEECNGHLNPPPWHE